MHPKIIITIDGQPVSGTFIERLVSVRVVDKEGSRADTIDFVLEAGPQFFAIPKKKQIVTASFGYVETGVEYMGSFSIDDVELSHYPFTCHVQGKSADMRGAAKEHRSRHWDGETFGGVAQKMAGEMGLAAQIAPSIAAFRGKDGYFAQEGESNIHWLERQAQRLNGLFAIKDGKLIVSEKGTGLTAGGAAVGALLVTPPMVKPGSYKVKWSARDEHSKVRAGYHDLGEGKRKYEEADGSPDGEVTHTLRHTYANQDEAKRAAASRGKEATRSADTCSADLEGTPTAKAGAGLTFAGFHPESDGLPWTIESATHSYAKGQGYTTQITGKAKK